LYYEKDLLKEYWKKIALYNTQKGTGLLGVLSGTAEESLKSRNDFFHNSFASIFSNPNNSCIADDSIISNDKDDTFQNKEEIIAGENIIAKEKPWEVPKKKK